MDDVQTKDDHLADLCVGMDILEDESRELDEKACAKIEWTRSYVEKALKKW